MEKQKTYLKDYQAPTFFIEKVELEFDLGLGSSQAPQNSDLTTVKNKMFFKKIISNSDLILDGEDLTLKSVKLNQKEITYEIKDSQLILKNTPDQFELEIITELKPKENFALEGLYYSNGIYCTQCEAQSFRKITYFLDRPDVMTSFTVTIRADKNHYPILLSNGDRIKEQTLGLDQYGRNIHEVVWHDPFKKPAYLFALVAGDLGVLKDTYTTKSNKKISLEIYSKKGLEVRCEHAMNSLKKSMKWDEDTFNLEYDLATYMIVAIDDFNAGAMENKGLNIFNSRLVFANPQTATDNDYHAIESVIAHEYFHNWTGNRVTLRDWFHLSLKEGLTVYRDQEFSSDMTDAGVQRIQDVTSLRNRQFLEDAGPNAHPVRPEFCYSVDNFFTATIYEKGAEVIRMIETMVGKNGFKKGMALYFKKHDGQAVTIEDFVKCFEETNTIDLTQFKKWYNEARTPQIKVIDHYDSQNQSYKLTFTRASDHTMLIPIRIGLVGQKQINLLPEVNKTLLFTKPEESFVFNNITEKPIPSLNRGFGAPIFINYIYSDSDLLHLLKNDTDGFNQWEAGQKLSLKYFDLLIQNINTELPEGYLKTFGEILQNTNLSSALKALLLELPSDSYISQIQNTIHPEKFKAARTKIESAISKFNKDIFLTTIKNLKSQLSFNESNNTINNSLHFSDVGTRALLTYLLSYTPYIDTNWENICYQLFKTNNMTIKSRTLQILNDNNAKNRKKALTEFFEEFKDDALVLNKWFAIQAIRPSEDTLNDIVSLSSHSHFNINNPNNVYSLLRNYSTANICAFHNQRSYQFFADKIFEIDQKNPQVAARLASSFDTWKKLTPELKPYAEAALKNLVSKKLSNNTYEIISKSLD